MKAKSYTRKLLAIAVTIGAGLASYSCNGGSKTTQIVYEDGGTVVTYQDGGVVVTYVDGGTKVTYIDGGIEYQDGGVVVTYIDGGVVITYIDGGTIYQVADAAHGPFDAGPSTCSPDAGGMEALGPGVYGCGGSVSWTNRTLLCASSATACNEAQYLLRTVTPPSANYWLNEALFAGGTGTNACNASATTGTTCGTVGTPMRVCTTTQPDPEGNRCNWTGCTLPVDGGSADAAEYFGGCSSNMTAGALCCLNVGADAGASDAGCTGALGSKYGEAWGAMVGCAGAVEWPQRAALCSAGYHVCRAPEWQQNSDGGAPSHDYWTDDNLNYSGSGTNACTVSTTVGSSCYSINAAPMHICVGDGGIDRYGNGCDVTGCTLEGEPGWSVGGCDPTTGNVAGSNDAGNYNTAGTLCCAAE